MKNKTTYPRDFFSKALAFVLMISCSTLVFAQDYQIVGEAVYLDEPTCEYPRIFDPNNEQISIPNELILARDGAGSNGTACSTFVVSYNGFTQEAQDAFQFAVDIWSNTIESSVPIRINANYTALGPGVLGSASANGFFEVTGAGIPPNTLFPRALAEKLTGSDTDPFPPQASIDINCNFSSSINWYFGTDANPFFNQFDFVSVVLHELGHGLGFAGFARPNGANTEGLLRNGGFVSAYDNFVENGAGTSILDFPDPSFQLLQQLTGGNLFSNSPAAVAANAGVPPEYWAPNPFNQGSSYSHWDDNIFPNDNINSLMTPSIGNGQANHNTGPITNGLFLDMGWTLCPALSVNEFTLESLEVAPNPFNDNIRITLPGNYNDSDFNISILDVNGRVVLDKDVSSINRTIDMDLSQLKASIYFMTIEDDVTGLTVTKKIVRQ
ncbi:T9SS type A sorting domain-containing protein [Psychroserpens luteolus]|uniref:T9SS type A sorting domain-containing protein n=1 Tax=Psychroserpens luteolus TaxID=2855840 RepID=UPI001E309479|nr:T9SS type A sorting domain-containing protein [Psychroserpens luteolus]MCD2258055.1 T9SS type A sorting domain-containing protein [Psychroserpens luteolus]